MGRERGGKREERERERFEHVSKISESPLSTEGGRDGGPSSFFFISPPPPLNLGAKKSAGATCDATLTEIPKEGRRKEKTARKRKYFSGFYDPLLLLLLVSLLPLPPANMLLSSLQSRRHCLLSFSLFSLLSFSSGHRGNN